MTKKELSQLYHLKDEIKDDERRLEELKLKAISPSTPNLSGVYHTGFDSSKIEKYTAEICDIQAIIETKRLQCIHLQNIIERYIAEIQDSYIRRIFTLRFVECKSWSKIGFELHTTGDGARMACDRFLQKK